MKDVLLDTHIAIWFLEEKLSSEARKHLERTRNRGYSAFISIVSLWEIALKSSLKSSDGLPKLAVSDAITGEYVEDPVASMVESIRLVPNLHQLDLTYEDCKKLRSLPYPPNNHRDPFDRMLVTQALNRRLDFMSADRKLSPYFSNTASQLILEA